MKSTVSHCSYLSHAKMQEGKGRCFSRCRANSLKCASPVCYKGDRGLSKTWALAASRPTGSIRSQRREKWVEGGCRVRMPSARKPTGSCRVRHREIWRGGFPPGARVGGWSKVCRPPAGNRPVPRIFMRASFEGGGVKNGCLASPIAPMTKPRQRCHERGQR